jgi:hypothetical protein
MRKYLIIFILPALSIYSHLSHNKLMKVKEVKFLRKMGGVFFILLGITGIILPVLPGWIFIFIGLELIGIQLVFFDKIKAYVKSKLDKERGKDDKSSD